MPSLALRRMSSEDREHLVSTLLSTQNGRCFICEGTVDLVLHASNIDVDHVQPLSEGGKDRPENFAVTHAACNRSKQASDLRVARVLARFNDIAESLADETRSPDLGDVLATYGGAKYELRTRLANDHLALSFPEVDKVEPQQFPLFEDYLSGFRSAFVDVPIEYLHHDREINPRAIGSNLKKLVVEFHKRLPQLHVCLGWIESSDSPITKVKVFDGQHKAAAQILLGARTLPVRLFVDPDLNVLLTANTNAGTTLRQVAFDKSVQRSLGSSILSNRLDRYRTERSLPEDDESFSEVDLVNHFKGEARAMRRYVVDRVRSGITHHSENRLAEYIELGGRNTDKPLSYSTIEKTFFSVFISSDMLSTPFNHKYQEGMNPRQLEIEQVVRLMNMLAEQIYVGQFDFERGTARLETDVQKGNDVDSNHLRAFRMSKEEVVSNWVRSIRQIIYQYFILTGKQTDETRLFQYEIPDECWESVENFIISLKSLAPWLNNELSVSVFGTKRNPAFWQSIFETGRTPEGMEIMVGGLDLVEMIKGREG